MSKNVIKESNLSIKIKDVIKRYTLNFTDINENHNKYYNLEIIESNDNKFYIYTIYGRVGSIASKEYRISSSKEEALRDAEKIIKSKIKKGYVEVNLVQANVGSDIGKAKIESNSVTSEYLEKHGIKQEEQTKSKLDINIQNLIKNWFGSIDEFVVNTLDTSKCALGTLSIAQINKGRELLLEARKIVSASSLTQDLIKELNNISSKYYSNIPMNFGYTKLNPDILRFDNNDKLDKAFDILDTLEGVKNIQSVLKGNNAIDEKYKTLNTDIEWIEPNSPIYNWISLMFYKTKAKNHKSFDNLKITNIYKLSRPNEYKSFIKMAESIAKKKNQNRIKLPDVIEKIWDKRPKEDKEYEDLMERANIVPLFHGTRTPNFPKILSSRLMMRKPGFTVAGAMFDRDGGLYFASLASKSCQYSSVSGSYWAAGADNKGYLFLTDVALGKQTIATCAHKYTAKSIAPSMSVWAQAGQSLFNDEFIVYTEEQDWLRYVIEFSVK